jgi:hypothetical protein
MQAYPSASASASVFPPLGRPANATAGCAILASSRDRLSQAPKYRPPEMLLLRPDGSWPGDVFRELAGGGEHGGRKGEATRISEPGALPVAALLTRVATPAICGSMSRCSAASGPEDGAA